MIKRLFSVGLFAGALAFCGTPVFAQDTVDEEPPVITLSTPTGGTKVSKTFTVVGTVTDIVGVTEVRYRIEGSRKWRKAILIEEGGTNTTFSFRARLRSGKNKTRVYVRAFDAERNESDIVSRKFRRN